MSILHGCVSTHPHGLWVGGRGTGLGGGLLISKTVGSVCGLGLEEKQGWDEAFIL